MNEQPTHLDLFSGIGGFALSAGWAGFKTVGFCEIDPYCQAVLRKHWPQVPIHTDIKELRGGAYRGCSLLTGGFPCQPFSHAGKQRGKEDDRHLWPEMLRIIEEAKPRWIVGENVAGIINMELEQVCADLETKGYEVQPLIIPACAVNAPHRRDRVWIIANVADSDSRRLEGANTKRRNGGDVVRSCEITSKENVADTNRKRRQKEPIFLSSNQKGKGESSEQSIARRVGEISRGNQCEWEPEPELGRVANGISNRVDRLKGLGNAIVPQVAFPILEGIRKLIEENGEN